MHDELQVDEATRAFAEKVLGTGRILGERSTLRVPTDKRARVQIKALNINLAALGAAQPSTSARKTDGEIADEEYEGKNVYYTVTFLTAHGDDFQGTKGPFYIQFEGTMGTTELHSFWPFVDEGEWRQQQFYDRYVGEMKKIRIAPGTGNGWGLKQFMVFYPREKLWLYPDAWVDSDGPNIVTISL